MLKNNHFYNRTIRKMVVAFGTLFNDLILVRYSTSGDQEFERMRVPLSFGAKEKYLTRLTSDPNLTKSINTYVPRISFDLVGLTYDSSRKVNTLNRNFAVDSVSGAYSAQHAPVPYNFEFDLNIYVRNQEDGTQILEQILPLFTPDFTITVDLIPTLGRKYDIPIMLNSVTPQIDYEGDMSTTRLIIWNLTFTVKGYIFPATSIVGGLIRQANTNIFVDSRLSSDPQRVYVDMASGNGVYTTGETIRTVGSGKTGSVAYFANNSLGTLVVSDMSTPLQENDTVVGDYSNATYTIDTVDLNPIKTVSIVVTPNPLTANSDDDYGFTTTITEFPNTL